MHEKNLCFFDPRITALPEFTAQQQSTAAIVDNIDEAAVHRHRLAACAGKTARADAEPSPHAGTVRACTVRPTVHPAAHTGR